MSDYTQMDCTQLAAALAAETDPVKKAAIEAEMVKKGCGGQTDEDESGGGGSGDPGGH